MLRFCCVWGLYCIHTYIYIDTYDTVWHRYSFHAASMQQYVRPCDTIYDTSLWYLVIPPSYPCRFSKGAFCSLNHFWTCHLNQHLDRSWWNHSQVRDPTFVSILCIQFNGNPSKALGGVVCPLVTEYMMYLSNYGETKMIRKLWEGQTKTWNAMGPTPPSIPWHSWPWNWNKTKLAKLAIPRNYQDY